MTIEGLHFLPLDANSAYVLSFVDGQCDVETILDVCAGDVGREATLNILAHLLQLGAIELRDP